MKKLVTYHSQIWMELTEQGFVTMEVYTADNGTRVAVMYRGGI